jgi:HEAT repeat protein
MNRWIKVALSGAVVAMAGATAPTEARAELAVRVGLFRAHFSLVSSLQVALPGSEQGDPADSVYREGRRALNRGEFREAARVFSRLRRAFADSRRVGDSYYYEAYALSRLGGSRDLELALGLLDKQATEYPGSGTRDDAPALRVRIQSDLAARGDSEAAAEVFRGANESCSDSDQELRVIALSALLNMDSQRALPILQEVLKNRDECSTELRRQAVFLISQLEGDETVDMLLDLAHRNPDPDPEVREQAVFWLSQVDSEEALRALESILRNADDEDVQENAIFAISQHESARSTAILKEFAERPGAPKDLRENAIFWLGQSEGGGDYLRELYGRIEDVDLRENIVFGIAQSDRASDRAWLMEKALDEGESIDVRKNALFWAGQSGIDVTRLAELYSTVRDREMKEQVIFVLSQHNGAEAVDQLLRIAETEQDTELKTTAIFWLGQSNDPRAAEFLLKIIGG